MPITDEQAKIIKEQLLKQTQNLPEDKREYAQSFISGLDNEKLEEFLVRNKLIKNPEELNQKPIPTSQTPKTLPQKTRKPLKIKEDCIFCLLSNKLVPSLPIYEDEKYLACLEINPLNRGHTILIPKKHIRKTKSLKQTAFSLADKIGKHLIKQLDAQNFQISSSDNLKHAVINIIPVYKKQKPEDFKKTPASKAELESVYKKIGRITHEKKLKKKSEPKMKVKSEIKAPELKTEKIVETIIRLPRRIP